MALCASDLDSLPIPFPGNNPLAPERVRSCWEQERDAWDECRKIGDMGVAGDLLALDEDEVRQTWAWARAAHRTARECFEKAERDFVDALSDKHAACAAEAQKHLAAAVQVQLMNKLKPGEKIGSGLESLQPALDVFEQFIGLQQALTTAILGTIKDRIYKLRAERRRVASGEEEVLHNLNTLCRCMQVVLGAPVPTEEQQLQELRENTDDWERALDVCSQREDFGLREHMQALLPGLTLMSQHQKGWLQHVRNDLNGWLAGVEKELAERTARLRASVGALIEHEDGDEEGRQSAAAAIGAIKAETAQLQSLMENADAAVRRLIA